MIEGIKTSSRGFGLGGLVGEEYIEIDLGKTTYENISDYYQKIKKLKSKIKRLEEEIEKTQSKIKDTQKEEKLSLPKVKKKWYHSFRWMFTPNDRLIVGGRNAGQNDRLFSDRMKDNDLFFHADIPGGSVVILKDGVHATEDELMLAARFAGCYSRAWKQGLHTIDVYAVRKEQLSKHSMKGYIGRGSFAIEGERRWFKGLPLRIYLCVYPNSPERLIALPEVNKRIIEYYSLERFPYVLELTPGEKRVEEVEREFAKEIKKRFKIKVGDVLRYLPGDSSYRWIDLRKR